MKSIDIGTMFLVKGEIDPVSDSPSFTVERNVFLEAAATDDTESTLKENNWSYAKHDNKFYILGEDAIKIKNLITVGTKPEDRGIVATKVGDLRRPMKDGILNTGEEKLSVAIIQKLIAGLLGKPSHQGEILCFCVPGDAVDRNLSALFHTTMLTNFVKSLGYTAEHIPEALAIIYSERPVAEDPSENDGEAPFSGISFSFGAGMCNVCFAWKRMPLINFSIARSGDWIDDQASKTAGVDVSSMTRYKEKNFDLNYVDYSDMRQAALDIFYQNMIEHALANFSSKFNSLNNKIDTPLEIVIAGGTASIPGFLDKFKSVLNSQALPFKVKDVKMAEHPFYAVSNGCLIKAMSSSKKTENTQEQTQPVANSKIEQEEPLKKIKIKN